MTGMMVIISNRTELTLLVSIKFCLLDLSFSSSFNNISSLTEKEKEKEQDTQVNDPHPLKLLQVSNNLLAKTLKRGKRKDETLAGKS